MYSARKNSPGRHLKRTSGRTVVGRRVPIRSFPCFKVRGSALNSQNFPKGFDQNFRKGMTELSEPAVQVAPRLVPDSRFAAKGKPPSSLEERVWQNENTLPALVGRLRRQEQPD